METVVLVGTLAVLAAAVGLAFVVESSRRNRRATKAAERKRREQIRKADLRPPTGEIESE